MMIVSKSNKQDLLELMQLTLLNCLNANGIIRFKYNKKLKQKQERENNESKFKKY